MADSDPFSGIHLSPPPPPPAEINPDDLSPSRIFALALTEYDNIHQPALRAVANLVASRITSLTESQIVRLSDDKIGRLIETELSRLSDDEKFCLLKAEISKIFDGTGDAVLSSLATGFTTIHEKLVHDFADFVERNKTAIMIIDGFFYVGFVILGILIYYKIKEWIYQISTFVQKSLSRLPPLGSVIVPIQRSLSRLPPLRRAVMVPANTTQQDQPRPSRRPNCVPYSRDLEGLKCIGEIYSQGTNMEAEQRQEGTSRAIVPISRYSGATYLVKRSFCSKVD